MAFPYLRWTIAYNNSDWAPAYQNLQIYQRQWEMVAGVLEKMVAKVRARGAMYKMVEQTVLLYCRRI